MKCKTKVEKAGLEDIDTLVELRLDYLVEGGFIDFLQNIKHGDPEERKELRDWATYMGWTGKLPKVESLL